MKSGGAWPTHLSRRGAVFAVRFRLPSDVAIRTGVKELQKSLNTKELSEARLRCAEATAWFQTTMEVLRAMTAPSRDDLESAARAFFDQLQNVVDKPRGYPVGQIRQAAAYDVHESQERIADIDRSLLANEFDRATRRLAEEMLAVRNFAWTDLDEQARLAALQLVSRAVREQMLYAIHQLTTPSQAYQPTDTVFLAQAQQIASQPLPPFANPPRPLRDATEEYLRKKKLAGLGGSHIQELTRALGWLEQVLGGDVPLKSVTKEQLRAFRTDLSRLDLQYRGREGLFRDRLTNVVERQIKSVTATRYWKSIQGFFSWCAEEGLIAEDPAAGLKIERRKGEVRESPKPFSESELVKLFSTPLYAGYASTRSVKTPGDCHARTGRWWSLVLSLFTGLRAGELSQLLPDDFAFDDDIPHLKVREEDGSGARVKTTKTQSSIRDVPLHPDLLTLGLREFVQRQSKLYPKHRVFREFRLGADGRKSDGMTKFWGDYLREFDLWSPGRATHVSRHTVVARLRVLGVSDEDIGAFVGHSGGTVTSKYGGAYPLKRKANTAETLDYGFDLLSVLGGPFDPKRHVA